jgi:hypothetical protein
MKRYYATIEHHEQKVEDGPFLMKVSAIEFSAKSKAKARTIADTQAVAHFGLDGAPSPTVIKLSRIGKDGKAVDDTNMLRGIANVHDITNDQGNKKKTKGGANSRKKVVSGSKPINDSLASIVDDVKEA